MKFQLFNYSEWLALLTSIICLKWLVKTPYFYFFPYMLLTVAAELAGMYFGTRHQFNFNNAVYNVTTSVEFLFFFYLFMVSLANAVLKKITFALALLYALGAGVNLCVLQGIWHWNSYSMLLGTIIIILLVFFYFFDGFERPVPVKFFREPMFWISIGIFLFYLGDFTFNLMYPFLQRNNLKREQYLFQLINHNLIVFEYICFSVALILCSRNRLTSKPQSYSQL